LRSGALQPSDASLLHGAQLEGRRLVVDPENRIDEINEANNAYPLDRGVPPPVESDPSTGSTPQNRK